jgi:hypothetical protein
VGAGKPHGDRAVASGERGEQGPNGTKVHTCGDIVHSGVTIGGRKVEHLVTAFTEMWYGNFRLKCDQLADGWAEAGD